MSGNKTQQDGLIVVVGLGATGVSCVRYFVNKGVAVGVTDSRDNPPGLADMQREFPDVPVVVGGFDRRLLELADEIVLSPGVAVSEPVLRSVIGKNATPVISDVELFRREVDAPLIAITGSNAKSTVTTLVGEMARDAGRDAVIAGNIGLPVMDLLNEKRDADLYVLELSSFQLETTHELNATVATILNVSPDHMDRYESMDEYISAKQRVYSGARQIVVNLDDPATRFFDDRSDNAGITKELRFTLGASSDANTFGLVEREGETFLAFAGEPLVAVQGLRIKGKHNMANALAALALGYAAGLPMTSMVKTLASFEGLPHRCQWVAEVDGVEWINDSKGTNVGATLAAIEGIGPVAKGGLILIAGGEGKGADFSALSQSVGLYVKAAVLIGRDRDEIRAAISGDCETHQADGLSEAVTICHGIAKPGDVVLLSPACASFDMFRSFEDRGEEFVRQVGKLARRSVVG